MLRPTALAATVLCLAAVRPAAADLPPPGPVIRHAVTFEVSPADDHAWIAYPVVRSLGAPVAAYERVDPAAEYDPGRSSPRIHAFELAALAPDGTGLSAAPLSYGVAEVPGGALAAFFADAGVPSAELPGFDPSGLPPGITAVVDTYALRIERETLSIRLVRSRYDATDHLPIVLPADAEGRRAVPPPEAVAPGPRPPPSVPPAPPPPPARPAPASGGCTCRAGSPVGAGFAPLLALGVLLGAARRCQ